MVLMIAAVELTGGQIIAGASRFVYGVAQLALLAFGVTAGVMVAGALPHTDSAPPLGWWAPWVGVLLVAGGFLLYSSPPKGSLAWIVLTLVIAYGAQATASLFVDPWLSGFFGAIILVPFARVISLIRSAPPTVVTTTCGFWILVPGAMGFMGVTQAFTGSADAGQALFHVAGSVLAIALGMLVGSGVSRDLVALRHALNKPKQPEDTEQSPAANEKHTSS